MDNSKEGYIPTRQKEINQMKGVEEEVEGIENLESDHENEEEEKKEISKNVDEELSEEEFTEEKDKQKAVKIKK